MAGISNNPTPYYYRGYNSSGGITGTPSVTGVPNGTAVPPETSANITNTTNPNLLTQLQSDSYNYLMNQIHNCESIIRGFQIQINDLNVDIANYRKDIIELQKLLSLPGADEKDINAQISSIESKIAALQRLINFLNKELTSYEGELANLNSKLDALMGKFDFENDIAGIPTSTPTTTGFPNLIGFVTQTTGVAPGPTKTA